VIAGLLIGLLLLIVLPMLLLPVLLLLALIAKPDEPQEAEEDLERAIVTTICMGPWAD
jgi:hypothetical protein